MTMKLSPTQIKEIAERVEKATPGPWVDDGHKVEGDAPGHRYDICACEPTPVHVRTCGGVFNADFIANSRADIPALLAHIAAQDGEIAKLERERDEQRHLIQEIAAENMRIFIALGGHPDEPRSDMELLDDLFNQFRRAESDRDEARARIAQLESQIAMKDGAQFAIRGVLGDLEFIAQGGNTATSAEALCGTYERVAARALTAIREALKGSAK